MPKVKYKEGNCSISFRLPLEMKKDFEKSLAAFNDKAKANFTQTDMLQVLVMHFIVETEKCEAKAEASKTDNKNIN